MDNGPFFLIVFFFFFFAAWLAGGGPTKPISYAGPYITPITSNTVTQGGYGDQVRLGSGSYSYSAGRSDLFTIQGTIDTIREKVQEDKLFGTPSPYKGQVTIGWGNNVGATDPDQEYITLQVASNAPQNITITGWRVQNISNDHGATIPKGTELLSTTNDATAPIVLHPGETAYLITGESPIDASFRENECLGYFTKKNFTPYLSQNCPSPQDDYDRYYTGNTYKDDGCYNLIRTLYSCDVPKNTSGLSSSCYNFIDNHLTYSGCVATHRGDARFWGNAWRIYLGRTEITRSHDSTRKYGDLWQPTHDAIKLLDQNGKTVDLYEY